MSAQNKEYMYQMKWEKDAFPFLLTFLSNRKITVQKQLSYLRNKLAIDIGTWVLVN